MSGQTPRRANGPTRREIAARAERARTDRRRQPKADPELHRILHRSHGVMSGYGWEVLNSVIERLVNTGGAR